jgi:hypothetical protein
MPDDAMLTPQPPPILADGDLWAELISEVDNAYGKDLLADMAARREFGIKKHGTPLQVANGRDFAADTFQEVLDGAVYAFGESKKYAAMPRMARDWRAVAMDLLDTAERIKQLLETDA